MLQIDLAHIHARRRSCAFFAKIFNVDDAQRGVFQRHLLSTIGQAGLPAYGAVQLKTFAVQLKIFAVRFHSLAACRQGHGSQLDAGAAVVKAALVNLDTTIAGRVIHLDTGWNFFARFFVGDDDFAGKQLGHARGVMLDNEFFQLYRKRQILNQHAARAVENSG